jgi:methylase of polypeptide subunit release factors
MTWSISGARELIARCRQLRDAGVVEAVLRTELHSRLRAVFPDAVDEGWINHCSEGTEAHTTIGRESGGTASRFVDTLVRSTVIEYEADLRQRGRWDTGYGQVREYISGALRAKIPMSQIRGVLSDTVDWHVFDFELRPGVNPATCTAADVTLHEVESFTPSAADDDHAERLVAFLKKHLAREQSRPLTSQHIAGDLGFDSPPFRRHVDALLKLVTEGRDKDSSIALATGLWSEFVDSLERQQSGFRAQVYVDEVYIGVVARLLAANVLEGRALFSEDAELTNILVGGYFSTKYRLRNMVEDDYFGWLLRAPYVTELMPVAREIQRDLYAYDFSYTPEHDLFGRLMTELARRSQRKLLGQEWTPSWLARILAARCLDAIEASPRIVDMCCGSGSILAEIIKERRRRKSDATLEDLVAVATGFDIDPLAVMLAKTTWVITLASLLKVASEDVVIPIYHADSLFVVTPLTGAVPAPGETTECVIVKLDGRDVSLPAELIRPELRVLFVGIVDWAYDEACAAVAGGGGAVTQSRADTLVNGLTETHRITITSALRSRVALATFELTTRMCELARANRNGIWAFILRNTYRPGLLAGQFNGLVSNPPWLAMSQLADNPYKELLSDRAKLYGVHPGGAAHLHLELATTYLLHAIDRYLEAGAAIACLLPGTVFNGMHHEKFRRAAYLISRRAVPFELQELWEIAPGTFKVRSAAVVGIKRRSFADVHAPQQGFHATEDGLVPVRFETLHLGTRTAWVLGGSAAPLGAPTDEPVPPQGADLMPRTAVVVEILDQTGTEWRVRTPPAASPLYFAVKDAKKLKDRKFPGFVAPQFLFRMVQSLNLLPFTCAGPLAPIALPAQKAAYGQWQVLDAAAIRTAGFRNTARRFKEIDRAVAEGGVVKALGEKIDERNKLTLQVFPRDQHLVLNGAGGGISCAALLPTSGYEDIVVDQTLYWRVVTTATEAWYRVGLLNSGAITEAIRPFNPQGEFGARHLHTLPHRVIPLFDSNNDDHLAIARLAEQLAGKANALVAQESDIQNPSRPIAARRRKLRTLLRAEPEFAQLEELCAAVLGTTPGGADE